MNYSLILAQPTYYYENNEKEIQANLRRELIPLEEIIILADEIKRVCEIPDMEPFKYLIKAVEKEVEGHTVYGYYLVGVFTLESLKTAISSGFVGKRTKHPAFSDKPIPEKLEDIVISYDDTRILVEYGRGTKFISRKNLK